MIQSTGTPAHHDTRTSTGLGSIAILVALVSAVALVLAACSSGPKTSQSAVLDRVDAFPGATVVVPLPLDQVDPWHSLVARIDGGRRLEARLCQVVVRIPITGEGSDEGWLPASGVWTSKPPNARDRSNAPTGTWVAVVTMPSEPGGGTLTLGRRAYSLNWLTAPTPSPALPEGAEPILDPWRPVLTDALTKDPSLAQRIAPEARSPLTRWRFKLLTTGLRPSDDSDAPPFTDAVIEALARQNEDRWRAALLLLWSANPELAARLKQRLAALVDFSPRALAPAWSVNQTALDRLLADLLNPGIPPSRRAEFAEAWLTDQPGGVAWVVDDGGLLDDQRKTMIPTIGIANLQDRSTLVWAAPRTSHVTPDPNPAPSMSTLKLLVPLAGPSTDAQPPAPTAPITAHVGRWSTDLAVIQRRLPVTPPGFAIGPLLRDYTMRDWQEGATPAAVRPEWATMIMLHRPAPDPAAPPSGAQSRRWELLVECRLSTAITDPGALKREAVRLYFGPSALPTAILRVDMTGAVTNEQPLGALAPPELAPPPGRVEVLRTVDRWSFRITLPPGAIEPDGLLRIGVARMNALGQRSAWPRPMLPWQQEPGRAALDAGAWSPAGSAPTEDSR